MEFYEERHITKYSGTDIDSYNDNENDITLRKAIMSFDKIILLGNPGVGKTTELNVLFDLLWKEKEGTGIIPFLINLKYYRKNISFEELINNDDWIIFPQVIFILDGLDEIADIQDFISGFENFISKNKNRSIKYVVSCRTNIYSKYLAQITDFQPFILKSINIRQARSILEKKFGIKNLEEKFFENIDTPFFLNLFAEYYGDNGKLPQNISQIWELYVSKALDNHKSKVIKRTVLNKPKSIKLLKMLSLINELMQKNYTTDEELYSAIGDEYDNFIENPFIIKNEDSNYWGFIHRQIQEYFVAKSLVDKDFTEILDFIRIEETNFIHPSLFNSLTFLLDIMDVNDSDYEELLNWIKANQIELLFKSDSNRLSKEVRIRAFQEYFEEECIKKTLWISTNRAFEVSEIADFGDFKENVDYLLDKISTYPIYHERVLFSALKLLNFFSESSFDRGKLKLFLLRHLKLEDFPMSAKSEIIRIIQKHNLVSDDESLMTDIYNLFKKETHKQLNNSLLYLISEKTDIDKYYEFIKHEYLLINNLKERVVPDEVLRGNRFVLNKLILRLKDSNNFIDIISCYFNNEIRPAYSNDFEPGLLDKCVNFIKDEQSFLINLLSRIKDNYRFLRHDSIVKKIIIASNKEKDAIDYLINSTEPGDSRYFISQFIQEDNISDLVNLLLKKNISHQEIEYYRNNIGNAGKRKLAVMFNNLMEDRGVKFKEPVVTEEQFVQYQEEYKQHTQDNFDILFDKKRLIKNIERIFKLNENRLTRARLNELRRDWYDQNGHGNEIDVSLSILDNISYSRNESVLSFEEVKEIILRDNFNIVDRIRKTIEKYQNNGRKLIISDKQKNFIYDWSLSSAENTDFDAIAKSSGPTSFHFIKNNYKKVDVIFYFQKVFGFKLPQDFLLKSIEFYEMDKSGVLDDSFNYLKELIGNDELFDKQIVDNINDSKLLGLSKIKHFEYALKYNLKDSYQSIRKYLLTGESFFNERTSLEEYVIKANDKEILLELCVDDESYIYWASIHLMLKLDFEKEFGTQKALQYLENKKERFRTDAFAILIEQNHVMAYKYMIEGLAANKPYPMHSIKFSNYKGVKPFKDLFNIYYLIYNEELDEFESSYYKEFYRSLIMNLSSGETDFKKVQKVLLDIKKSLEKSKSDLFFINLLIDDSKGAYISSKSTPFNFREAKKVALEFIE
ncbi:hypothetical protein FEE95_20990 [Maribacter algarum]|uniref:NACHT domain-containing protein n=1 Tax=Maribacter algarum (ex Zhang et al. 2020) TaxID=2578118 RepID=A0A5S3PE61_9FLAO|nr:hypothetical protein [Maribacter algarum]TMM52167.1 hypothetical protein FEE95_20990 [Maribacter algarum]